MSAPPAESQSRIEAVSQAADAWRHELAQLGGRNTLLWHKDHQLGIFDLTVAHPSGVAKLLTGGRTLLSELVREKIALGQARTRITAIHAKTVELRDGHGVESCFVAIGMASWHLRRAKTVPRAPVLLRSASIKPVDATCQDFALRLDDHVVFNPVLANYLRGEVGIDIDTAALADLSLGDGFDPRQTYQELEELCAAIDGFGINPQVVLSTYPWAKLDLVARLSNDPAALAEHELVAALAGHPVDLPPVRAAPTSGHDPHQEPSVLDADAAQREVISQVHHGASLVLDTPTGTGATQTVANMVADGIARGRTTLLVSEERAALSDAAQRLRRVGLGDAVLELSEDPQRAAGTIRDLASQLHTVAHDVAPELGADPVPGWVEAQAVLAAHEDAMHAVHQPWGCSLADTQRALAALAKLSRPPLSHVRLEPAALTQMPRERMTQMAAVLREAAAGGAWERGRVEDPWYGATLRTEEDAARAVGLVAGLVAGELTEARQQIAEVCRVAGLPEPLTLTQWLGRLDLIARVHETHDHFRPQIYEAPLNEFIAALSGRDSDVERPGALGRGRSKRAIRTLLRPGKPPPDLIGKLRSARQERAQWEALGGKAARPHTPRGWEAAVESYDTVGPSMEWLTQALSGTSTGVDLMTTHLDLVLERLLRLDARADRAFHAARAYTLLQPLREAGLALLVDDLARRGVGVADIDSEVELVYQTSLLDHIGAEQEARTPPTPRVIAAARQLRIADRNLLQRNRIRSKRTYVRRLSRAVTAHPGQVRALAAAAAGDEHDLRAVIARSPDVVCALRPVLIGSPLVLPRVLPSTFGVDLLVVEEAGRTSVAACIDALSRSAQAVIVGDGLRHGPRDFSYVAAAQSPDAVVGEARSQGRSLLTRAREVLPARTFTTHYRAVDQRLISPLNAAGAAGIDAFPGVWPAARAGQRLVPELGDVLPTAVASVIDHLLRRPTRSLVVLSDTATGAAQIWDQVRVAAADNPALRAALTGEDLPRMWCSSVALWSGVERDRCIWVRDAAGEADPRDVATVLAAARRSVTVVTVGCEALADAEVTGLVCEPPSEHPLVTDVITRLRAEGLIVRSPVGTGRYAVPIGIEDPARPGRMLVAVDLDIEPLEAAPGRDDVRLRTDQLLTLGWSPTRVFSTNLFRDPARDVAALALLVRQASQDAAQVS
ncbi:MAG: hypothetical protein WA991_15190 [Ornithinimicrobium sp.]